MTITRSIRVSLVRSVRSLRNDGALPSFLILGAQKAGTTSLFDYICQSPDVKPPLRKEVHYFDRMHVPPLRWYRSFFPAEDRFANSGFISGEATPFYLFHPDSAARIFHAGLRPKMIVILRCPVERAWSHYRHERRKGRETLAFPEALAAESDRLEGVVETVLDARHLNMLKRFSYLARGQYARQLRRYADMFDVENMHVVSLDALRDDPRGVMERCCEFLGVRFPGQLTFRVHNHHDSPDCMPRIVPSVFQDAFCDELREIEELFPEAAVWRRRIEAMR